MVEFASFNRLEENEARAALAVFARSMHENKHPYWYVMKPAMISSAKPTPDTTEGNTGQWYHSHENEPNDPKMRFSVFRSTDGKLLACSYTIVGDDVFKGWHLPRGGALLIIEDDEANIQECSFYEKMKNDDRKEPFDCFKPDIDKVIFTMKCSGFMVTIYVVQYKNAERVIIIKTKNSLVSAACTMYFRRMQCH